MGPVKPELQHSVRISLPRASTAISGSLIPWWPVHGERIVGIPHHISSCAYFQILILLEGGKDKTGGTLLFSYANQLFRKCQSPEMCLPLLWYELEHVSLVALWKLAPCSQQSLPMGKACCVTDRLEVQHHLSCFSIKQIDLLSDFREFAV